MPTLTDDSRIARAMLAANRPVPRGAPPVSPERMFRHVVLDVWYDPQHAFRPVPGCDVLRAIDDCGQFCWLVRRGGGRDTLSRAVSPYDVTLADHVGGTPPDTGPGIAVRDLAAALRRGEIRIDLTGRDFRSVTGVAGLARRTGMPGWLAGWLLPLLPQMGRAIWAGHRRTLTTRQARLEQAAAARASLAGGASRRHPVFAAPWATGRLRMAPSSSARETQNVLSPAT